jgi:hypothetical protein
MFLSLLPPNPLRRTSPWAPALIVAVLSVPLVLVILVLAPALMVGPFLPGQRQRLTLRLLVLLSEWATAIPNALRRDTS